MAEKRFSGLAITGNAVSARISRLEKALVDQSATAATLSQHAMKRTAICSG
jgi:hypothetical protein